MENPHALSTQEKWINLSRKEIKHIFIYYCSVFIISLIVFGIIIYRFIVLSEFKLIISECY